MAAKTSLFGRIRLVYRRSPTLLKCVVLAALVLSTVCLLVLRSSLQEEQRKTESLRQEAALLEQKNTLLEQYISELGTVQGVKRIALTELDLVTPDTILFQPTESIPE